MALVMLNILLTMCAICFALRLGGLPEQLGGAVLLAMLVITYLGLLVFPRLYETVDPIAVAVDAVGLLGFAVIGIFSTRVWPLWASAFQLLSVGAHCVRALDFPVRPIVYAWMKSAPTWAVLLLLLGGTLFNRKRRQSTGNISSPT